MRIGLVPARVIIRDLDLNLHSAAIYIVALDWFSLHIEPGLQLKVVKPRQKRQRGEPVTS